MSEISGDGMIVIDGENVETVYYWLTVAPKAGPLIAEGSIGSCRNTLCMIVVTVPVNGLSPVSS